MKAIYIYNDHDTKEIQLIEQVNLEMGNMVHICPLSEVPQMIRMFVRATPCLIPITDELQGENLLSEDVDGKLIITSKLFKRLEEEEKEVHNQETFRLDNMINIEKNKAIDEYTLSLIDLGVL